MTPTNLFERIQNNFYAFGSTSKALKTVNRRISKHTGPCTVYKKSNAKLERLLDDLWKNLISDIRIQLDQILVRDGHGQ